MATLRKTNSEPTQGEKKFVQEVLLKGQPPIWMQWVTKRKRDKVQDRLLVVGKYRIFSIKRTLTGKKQIQRMGHMFDLKEIYSADADRVVFKFRDFEIDVQAPGAGSDLLHMIRENFQTYTCSFAEYALPRIVLLPAERQLPALARFDPGPANGFLATYEAYCDYYNIVPSEEFRKFVVDLSTQNNTDFLLDECPGIERKENPINFIPIKAALRHNTYFTSFVFKNVPRRDVAECLSDPLTHNITLKKLLLNNVDAREEAFVNIGLALKKNLLNSIIDIDFSNNPIKDKGAIGLADGLQFMNHSLWRLKLSNCGIGPKGCAAVLQAFCFGKDVAKGIQELDLTDNNVGQLGSTQMCNWFNQATVNCQLRYLLIANTKTDLTLVFRAMKNATVRSVEEIDISNIRVDQTAAFALATVIDSLPKLQVLTAVNCNMNSQQFDTILRSVTGNQSINDVTLNPSSNDVGVQGAVTVSQFMLNSFNIGALFMRNCGFKKEGLTKIIDALGLNAERSRLKAIDLSMNFHQGTSAKMLKLIGTLGESVKKHPTLEYLGLQGDNNKAAIGKEIEPLFKALASNPSLVELDITGNKIGDQLAVTLSDGLRTNTKLKSLSWDNNNIAIGGWRALLNILATNRTLVHCPSPNMDIEKAIRESKTKEQFRDRTKEVMDQIRDILIRNSGGNAYTSLYKIKLGKTYREVNAIQISGEPTAQFYEQLQQQTQITPSNSGSYGGSSSSYEQSAPAPPANNYSGSYQASSMGPPPTLSVPGYDYNSGYGGGAPPPPPPPGGSFAPPPPPPPPGASAHSYGYNEPAPPPPDDYYGQQGYGYEQPPAYDYPVEFDDSQYDDQSYNGAPPPPPPPPPF